MGTPMASLMNANTNRTKQNTTNSVNQLNLTVKPSKFAGRQDENVNVWIFQYEQCMKLSKVPESIWTQLSLHSLKDGAATWFLSLFSKKDPAGCPWEDYKDELRTAFQPCNFLDKLRDHVYEIKQGNDFDAYVKDMS